MLDRTKSALALAIAVAVVAVGSLTGAPTAAACPIEIDGNGCVVGWQASLTTKAPSNAKHTKSSNHAKHKKAPVRHVH